ncbi:unnamed protein product [Parajaminaea phylloscopi]
MAFNTRPCSYMSEDDVLNHSSMHQYALCLPHYKLRHGLFMNVSHEVASLSLATTLRTTPTRNKPNDFHVLSRS